MTMPGNESDYAFATIYAEIERRANRKASWTSGIVMLAVTVALFFILGFGGQGWKPLAIIVGVLFFHELGHLAAMRLFHYRNLRMFFIPFLGATVTGQNYNVPGWKKAIVSLAGPLPGIALGTVVGIAAAIGQWPSVMEAAFFLLVINAFNLLPIMPLDGGQIMHAVLFSRHPMFDVAFRTLAALVLLASWTLGMKVLAVLGVVMLIGLPTIYRVGKVVQRLRDAGFDARSPDARTIPVEAARRIHEELQTTLPAQPNANTSAMLTLQVFESLNARPPGWLASLGLVAVQGGSFLWAAVILVGLLVARHAIAEQQKTPVLKQPAPPAVARLWAGKGASPGVRAEATATAVGLGKRFFTPYSSPFLV